MHNPVELEDREKSLLPQLTWTAPYVIGLTNQNGAKPLLQFADKHTGPDMLLSNCPVRPEQPGRQGTDFQEVILTAS